MTNVIPEATSKARAIRDLIIYTLGYSQAVRQRLVARATV